MKEKLKALYFRTLREGKHFGPKSAYVECYYTVLPRSRSVSNPVLGDKKVSSPAEYGGSFFWDAGFLSAATCKVPKVLGPSDNTGAVATADLFRLGKAERCSETQGASLSLF